MFDSLESESVLPGFLRGETLCQAAEWTLKRHTWVSLLLQVHPRIPQLNVSRVLYDLMELKRLSGKAIVARETYCNGTGRACQQFLISARRLKS
jgi:hypothetical protein